MAAKIFSHSCASMARRGLSNQTPRLLKVAALALGSIAASPVAASQLDPLFQLSLDELMNIEVVTSSRYKESIEASPANIHVFTHEEIHANAIQTVEDLLQILPGVHLQKYSILGTNNTVTFRGSMGNNKFLILQDGVRISSPAGERTVIGYNYPVYYAKRVEVLMGPASVVYGADAFMGVINIITHDESDETFGEVVITAGTDQYGYISTMAHKKLGDDSFYNASLQVYRSQNFSFDEDFPELYNDPTKTYDMDPTRQYHVFLNYKHDTNWQFGFNHTEHSNSTNFTARPSFSTFDENANILIRQTMLYGKYTLDFSESFRSSTLLTLMNYELDNESYFSNLFTGGQHGYKYASSERISLNQEFEFDLNKTHLLSGGLVYDNFDTIPQGPDLPSPFNTSLDPEDQNLNYPFTMLPIVFFEKDYHNIGMYVQDNWQIDEKWRMVAGLRYDDNSFYGSSTNPRVSLIYKADERNLYKLLYGHAFLAPAPDLAGTSFGSFTGAVNGLGEWISTGARFRVPNPDLKPEQVRTLEFNYEHWFDKNNHLKLAPYYSEIEDVILLINDAVPDQAIPGADLQQTNKNDNVGNSTVYGLDITIDNQINIAGKDTINWLNISYMDGELINNGQKSVLPMTAEWKLTAGSTINFNNKNSLTTKFYWVDETHSNQPESFGSNKMIQVPSYYLIDMHYVSELKKNMHLQLNVYNLLDEKYSNAAFPPTFIAFEEAPQPGRLVTVSLAFSF